jgi:drug/metabolite transporter (DMT)-like permease
MALLLGYLLFGVVPVLLKQGLQGGLDAGASVVLRFVVALLLMLALLGSGLSLKPVNKKGLAWRGLFGGLAVASFFYAVHLCGAGLGTLLNYTHSLWANVFAVLFLRQHADRWL